MMNYCFAIKKTQGKSTQKLEHDAGIKKYLNPNLRFIRLCAIKSMLGGYSVSGSSVPKCERNIHIFGGFANQT